MAVEILSIPAMSAECERLFSSGGLMVSPLRSQLEASTIGLAQTLRSWLKAGVIQDSVMNVVDLGSEDGRDRGLDVIKSGFNEDLEDGDQVDTMDD
jgi:hypothetical protein